MTRKRKEGEYHCAYCATPTKEWCLECGRPCCDKCLSAGEGESMECPECWIDDAERCPVCGQPDNVGDCNHKPMNQTEGYMSAIKGIRKRQT